jgi:DNA topoisomerase VI subunit B
MSKKAVNKGSLGLENLVVKSAAEFFADNQNIAGFDNPGKALYTTVREFVENSLDACESAGRLPSITLVVQEMNAATLNLRRGVDSGKRRKDQTLYTDELDDDFQEPTNNDNDAEASDGALEASQAATSSAGRKRPRDSEKKKAPLMFYRISCRDNGCGIAHERIPDSLGRVLAGSKYGVRQTRGKFGLGAKMALIWAKKSTGMPIEVTTAHGPPWQQKRLLAESSSSSSASSSGSSYSASASASQTSTLVPQTTVQQQHMDTIPARISRCILDIDIHKNEPNIIKHEQSENTEGWIGTEISVTISGAWSTYKARIMSYFQQLAVITPYAELTLEYENVSESVGGGSSQRSFKGIGSGSGKNDFSFVWRRRSTQIPRIPTEVKHHPSALNELLCHTLIDNMKRKTATATLLSFLTSGLQGIDRSLATRLITELGSPFSPAMLLSDMNDKQVRELTRLLGKASVEPPSGQCLSPAGEYNLRLGIMKELLPDLVATHSSGVSVHEGHPFIVEAGVALGGKGAPGVSVHRFANRIPLLFEGGADVATASARRIEWSKYKIDHKTDTITVFVSLVSTRVPFKGTGKEYIGDDIPEIREAVMRALQACCSQLKVKILRALEARTRLSRRKNLTKYVPDVVRALMAGLKSISARRSETLAATTKAAATSLTEIGNEEGTLDQRVYKKSAFLPEALQTVLSNYSNGKVTEAILTHQLNTAVERADLEAALEGAEAQELGISSGGSKKAGGTGGSNQAVIAPVFIAPTPLSSFTQSRDLFNSACGLRIFKSAFSVVGSDL